MNTNKKKSDSEFKDKLKIFLLKIKHRLSLYKMSNLMDEIYLLGYEISGKNIAFVLMTMAFMCFIVGYLLKLRAEYILVLILLILLCVPIMVIAKFRHDFQMKRFNDIVAYMEQMIYAFHKNGKIRSSLIDVHKVSKGTIKQFIGEMLYVIDFDMTTPNIYEKAFAIMQNEYDCTRLKILHDYLLNVERNGGRTSTTLNIMLEDIRDWSERVLTYQSDRKNIQGKTLISICCAMMSCGIMVNLIPAEYSTKIIDSHMYQICTIIVLMLNVIVYVFSSSQVSVSYLDNEMDKKKTDNIKRQTEFLANWHKKNHLKVGIIKALILSPLLGLGLYLKMFPLVIGIGVSMLFLMVNDFIKKNNYLKNVTNEIKKVFPIWLRNLILYLDTDNVHVAVRNSYESCPAILKEEVGNFIDAISADPVSMRPYLNFLSAYNAPELKLAIHYLYSLATFGSEEMTTQLDYLVKQNSKLEITEERIRNEDSLTGFALMILIPMLIAVLKLMLDLLLFIGVFMGNLQQYGIM